MISHLKIQATTQHKIIATLNKLLQVQSKSYCKRVHTAIGAPSVTEGSLATFNVSALMTQNANVIDSWLELQQVTLNWVTLLSQHYVHNMRWDSMLNPRVIFFFYINIYIYPHANLPFKFGSLTFLVLAVYAVQPSGKGWLWIHLYSQVQYEIYTANYNMCHHSSIPAGRWK